MILICFLFAPCMAEDSVTDALSKHDLDSDGRLNSEEIRKYYLDEQIPKLVEKSTDFADDMLSYKCEKDCDTISIQDAADFVARLKEMEAAKKVQPHLGWSTLGFSRFVVDTFDPRVSKYRAPFIFSFKRDNEAVKKNQFSFLGGIQLVSTGFDFDQLGNYSVFLSAGLEFDIDGSRKNPENSLQIGVPVTFQLRPGTEAVEAFLITLTPKFVTDADFDREVYEGVISLAVTSKKLGTGFFRPPVRDADGRMPPVSFFWIPSLQFEIGSIQDAGNNEKLAALKSIDPSYFRIAPRVEIAIYPWAVSERLRFGFTYLHRFDPDQHFDRGYFEFRAAFDVVRDGWLELTAVYRVGEKPPDFKKIDDFLIGIGIKQ